jgi:hypothetical protein
MFSNPATPLATMNEGLVTSVDSVRLVANVTTTTGQRLVGVPWLMTTGGSTRGSDTATPHMGDRVVIDSGLGHPMIIGYLPKMQTSESAYPPSIASGTSIDTGNYTTAQAGNSVPNQNKPTDMVVGDRVLGSFGGGIVAILRGGSLLFKSSSLASIFVSKMDDLVKIVSRNFIHFSDVCSDVMRNIGGRVFRYTGYANDFTDATTENYSLNFYYGDTVMAEAVKSSATGSGGAANTILYKEQLLNAGVETFHRTLDMVGDKEEVITVGGITTTISQTGSQIVLNYDNKQIVTINADLIELNFNNQQTVTVTANNIELNYNNQQTVNLTGSDITLTHSSGAETQLTSSGVFNTFGGHFANVTAAGVQLG